MIHSSPANTGSLSLNLNKAGVPDHSLPCSLCISPEQRAFGVECSYGSEAILFSTCRASQDEAEFSCLVLYMDDHFKVRPEDLLMQNIGISAISMGPEDPHQMSYTPTKQNSSLITSFHNIFEFRF